MRGFKRFSEVLRGFSKALSETLSEPIFLSELRVVLPLIVLPLKTPANHRSTSLFVEIVRAARLQNEIAPEKFLNRYEKRFEKREKGSEKRSETRLKIF